MKNIKIKCDIYTRVSTTMQVDGYSLDAQKEKLRRYAEFQNMEIVNEYSDEGKSGKSVEGRPEFQRMLDNIENGTDEVQFVLVFKLSRFGRNAADVLNSLQRMQDFGVNLICVEDGIDSSKDSGKLMISVLSAVAEIERENILVQTMEGRKQKAREGKWNGGFAPYGYELVNGELQIAEDEAEVIRLIYDKFIHTNMGIAAIAIWLNQHGYKKKKRQNNTLDAFAASFIKGVLDNPVYCGKLAYGRRKNEKVAGTRNEYRIVKQENYMLYDGIHEGIISETDWELAHQKRVKNGVKYEKIHSLDHEHILSGILKCPLCGSGMYGNVNRKKKKDGTLYKDYFYYACKHRRLMNGHRCDYHKQWSEDKVNNAVEEVIRKLVQNPKFEEAIRKKIGSRIDTDEIEREIENLEKQHRQLTGAKARLGQQMDNLDIMDKFYEKKYQDMETRLYRLYDEIEGVENSIEEVKKRLLNIQQQKISEENVYQFLLYFDKLYDKFTDLEKKEFLNSFVERVDIYDQEQPDGRFLKHIKFRFPVYFGDRETQKLCWDNESTVESKLGEGSCFTVILPFKIDTNARPEEKEDFNADISGVRILLVEDNELNAEIAEFMLTENGAKVETVKNGLEAVQHFEACESGTYDVILMDVMMPVMDGLTATKTIRSLERQDAKTIPIIAMTANAFREDAEKCMEAGMNAHLAKPLDDKTIKQTICEELRSSRDR
ncbi:recombinase family protein [Blautia sp. DFI.6.71]|uniref:recombinase family protein n=1 Tax=Blautia sp. DFI.6.71 TaxID=2885262 RepID=UPI002F4071A1